MTIEELKQLKRLRGYSYEMMSKLSGVPQGTIQKIFVGETKAPRFATLEAIESIFLESDRANLVKETSAYNSTRPKKIFTIEDVEHIPEYVRVELLDGEIIRMDSPTIPHQQISCEILMVIKTYIREKGGSCLTLIAPFDVQLTEDNTTMLQPDLGVVCNRDKVTKKRIVGAPDLVMEVLSPSTKKRDCVAKLKKYEEAGVREVWLIDPDKETILVYDYAQEITPCIYSFTDQIPVGIFDGDLVIDFSKIMEEVY